MVESVKKKKHSLKQMICPRITTMSCCLSSATFTISYLIIILSEWEDSHPHASEHVSDSLSSLKTHVDFCYANCHVIKMQFHTLSVAVVTGPHHLLCDPSGELREHPK